MKFNIKTLTILMAFVMASITSYAQFGLRGGVNFAKVNSNDESIELKNNLGLQFGFVYRADLSDNIAFRPGVIYTQKGSKTEIAGVSRKTRTNYVEIPMDFQFRFGDVDDNRLGLYAGPYVGFLLSATTENVNVKDNYKSTEFGFNAGITYDIYMVTLGLNYGAGLSNVADDETLEDVDIKNQNISAFAVYNF